MHCTSRIYVVFYKLMLWRVRLEDDTANGIGPIALNRNVDSSLIGPLRRNVYMKTFNVLFTGLLSS